MDENKITTPIQQVGDISEGLKLGKNSKGYTWEIKISSLDIDELDRLNKEMLKRFSLEKCKN